MNFEFLLVALKLSLLGFGGGYAIIPLLMAEFEMRNWASANTMADTIAIAAMSPGSVAVNASIGLGLLLNGVPGILAAFVGSVVPCVLLVWAVAVFFMKASNNQVVQDVLYGLKAVIPGIILFAAVKMGIQNNLFFSANPIYNGWAFLYGYSYFEIKSLMILLITLVFLLKTKVHPIMLILAAAIGGVLVF